MGDFLAQMAILSERRVAVARGREREAALLRRAADTLPAPPLALHPDGFDLFAEIKRRSPSAGRFEAALEGAAFAAERARIYAEGGAAVVSVLTEPEFFGGGLDDLRAAASAAKVPTMRKDFLVDPYQVAEARAAGASGLLLILRLLDRNRLSEMLGAAGEMHLFVLMEAFDESDIERLLDVEATARRYGVRLLAGLNARDLETFALESSRLARLAGRFPPRLPRVAESGLEAPEDARAVAAQGYDAALVGSALMRAPDPGETVRGLIAAGREGAKSRCASA